MTGKARMYVNKPPEQMPEPLKPAVCWSRAPLLLSMPAAKSRFLGKLSGDTSLS